MIKLYIPLVAVEQTIQLLQASGRQRKEGIVLWLGRMDDSQAHVQHVYQPIHSAASDFFRIPRKGMTNLMGYLDEHGVRVVAQVHSHPAEAFHSEADNTWAIVRHLDALSLVLPYFAKTTTPQNFLDQAATFRLDQSNRWTEVHRVHLSNYLEVSR